MINLSENPITIRSLIFLNIITLSSSGLLISTFIFILHHGTNVFLRTNKKYQLLFFIILLTLINSFILRDFVFSGDISGIILEFNPLYTIAIAFYIFYNGIIIILCSSGIFNNEFRIIENLVIRFVVALLMFLIFDVLFLFQIAQFYQNIIINYISVLLLLISGLLFHFGGHKMILLSKKGKDKIMKTS